MTSTTVSTLNGRYHAESGVTRTTGQGGSLFKTAAQRLARKRFEAARRAHERQDHTDAYLDRTGVTGVDVGALLNVYAGR